MASSGGVSLSPGDVFGRDFRVVRPLASGGMGAVYVVEQLSTGRERALKLMRPELVGDPRSRERFVLEARAGAGIESDHVVDVIVADVDEATGAPWLVMELLRGETLEALCARRGALPPAEVLAILEQLGHGLYAAHRAGLVHRDLKPENVFLAAPRRAGEAFTVKILDFGIAKFVQLARTSGGTTGVVGTPMWMAPEQAGSAPVSYAADVWALGLIVFRMLTGRVYWQAANDESATLQRLLVEVLIDPLVPASARAAAFGCALPPGFDAWFARCVVREPAARFADAGQAMDALRPVLAACGGAAGSVLAAGPLRETRATAAGGDGGAVSNAPSEPGIRSRTGGDAGASRGGARAGKGRVLAVAAGVALGAVATVALLASRADPRAAALRVVPPAASGGASARGAAEPTRAAAAVAAPSVPSAEGAAPASAVGSDAGAGAATPASAPAVRATDAGAVRARVAANGGAPRGGGGTVAARPRSGGPGAAVASSGGVPPAPPLPALEPRPVSPRAALEAEYANDTAETIEAAAQQCARGRVARCYHAGVAFMTRTGGVDWDWSRAAQLLQRGCEGGHARSCGGLAAMFDVGGNGLPTDRVRARQYRERACSLGDANSCATLRR